MYTLAWQRDLTKEGITKPRNLLTIMLEEAQAAGLDVINPSFFEDFSVWDQGEVKRPVRGHG